MLFLKQSTAVTIKMGPFVDDTDGKTAETGLSISQSDIRLSKNGGDFVQTSNAAGAAHDENGYYDVSLSTTDTNTPGRLKAAISKSGALAVWQDFFIVPAHIYDWLTGAGGLYEKAAKVLVNRAIQTKTTGIVQYYDDDGQTVILTHTPADGEATITRTPS